MTTKKKVFAGLFLLAFVWVFLMGLLSNALGTSPSADMGGRGQGKAAPGKTPPLSKPTFTDDGSVKARVTDLEREKFHIKIKLEVTDKDGKELDDVKDQEMVVFEDGVPVSSMKLAANQSSGLCVALAVDFGSHEQIGKDQRELMKVGTVSLAKALLDGSDQFGLFINNHHALHSGYREAVPIGPVDPARRDQAFKRLDNLLQFFSGSGIYPTMGLALSKLAQTRGKRILIVMSTGRDDTVIAAEHAPTKDAQAEHQSKEKKAVADMIAGAKKVGIPVYMVYPLGTVKAQPGQEEHMKQLAAETGGSYYEAVNSTKLADYLVHEVIEKNRRKEYLLEYDSPNPVENGLTRKVEVFVRHDSSGTKVDTNYHVPGVLATGPTAAAAAPKAGSQSPGKARTPLWGVFFPLGLLLALLFAVPYGLLMRPRSSAAAAAPVAQLVPAATPVSRQAAVNPSAKAPPPVKPARGSAPAAPVPSKNSPPGSSKPARGGPEAKTW